MFFTRDMTVGKREDTIRHFGHHGIMGDDQRERAELAINPLDRFKNRLPRWTDAFSKAAMYSLRRSTLITVQP